MHILITGISGRIGANLAKALLDAGHTVRGLVWTRDLRLEKFATMDVELVEGTLTNPEDVATAVEGVDAIYHLGAAFQGGGPFTNSEYFEINVRGTFNMLEAARSLGSELQQFVFASSDALYNKYLPDGVAEPIREDEFPLEPGGQYALTKLLGEDLCRGYARNEGMPITICRFAMTLAGEEILDFNQFYLSHWRKAYARLDSPEAKAVATQLEDAAREKGERCLVLARDHHGRAYKKHIADVHDIVEGLLAVLGNKQALGEAFQLAAPRAFTWEEAVPYLAEKLELPWIDVNLAGHVPTYYEFDLSKGRQLLGYQPSFDIVRMIDTALEMRSGKAVGVVPTHVGKTA